MGGNRSVLVDHHLSGVIVGLTLATAPHEVYRRCWRPPPSAPG
jgi:L-ribulokinase